MAELYPWFVIAHLVGLVVFAISHGASMFVAFRIRADPEPARVAALLSLSSMALGPMYLGLVLLLIGGVGAAWGGNLWFEPWILASVAVLVVVLGVMYAVATPYYNGLRTTLAEVGADGRPTLGAEALAARLDTRRPEILVTVGSVGIVLLIWLMTAKPG